MAKRAEDSERRAVWVAPGWRRLRAQLGVRGRAPAALGISVRLVLLLTIVWAFTGPVDRVPLVVGAAALPPAAPESPTRASPVFQETGFAVADGPIGSYFAARGGVRTFGPPISNQFPLLGQPVQIFRDHVLKVEPNGAASTMNLFSMGAIPFRNIGGRIIPEVDQSLVASAPVPGTPEYGTRVQQFIQANAPDQWEGMSVGFYQAFVGTVRYEDAFPNGGNRGLLPGFSQEIWGLPVSRPVRDAQNPDVVLLRWERGVMVWSKATGAVTAVPLGEAFKSVLTGQGLGPERQAAAAGSQFLLQLSPTSPGGVARPGDLPGTVLTTAFKQGDPTINAAQLAYDTPTPTQVAAVPTATATTAVAAAPTATTVVAQAYPTAQTYPTANTVPPPNTNPPPSTNPGASGLPGAANPAPASAPAGSDPCYGDEQMTFAPEVPRVNNEVLIAVTSSRPHPYGRLAGTEKTTFVRERPGQRGYVWEWTVQLSFPGQHEYTFYVDSTIPCQKIQIQVRASLATRTPTPLPTPTPYGWDNGNNNGNNNNSNNNNDNNVNGFCNGVPCRDLNQFAFATGNFYDCPTFYSQGEAQRVLRLNPADPNQLDKEDGIEDGIACTTYRNWQYPNDGDYTIVARTGVTPSPGASAVPTPFNPAIYLVKDASGHYIDAYKCEDFASQADAQAVLRYGVQQLGPVNGDPNHLDTANPYNGTAARDGLACNTKFEAPLWWDFYGAAAPPEPRDLTPVQH
ncbi:MAG: hypothetical protein U0893_18170 [Chloroflexota bacterium]